MNPRPRIAPAVIVEGKYDKIKLDSLVDALVIPTDGFRIFRDKKMRALLKRLAMEQGLALLTDPDTAGFIIRRHLSGLVPPDKIIHVYLPDLPGKEPRKARPSKEGKLGVEGVPAPVLMEALKNAGLLGSSLPPRAPITKMDLYDAGLSGSADSKALRAALIAELGLPSRLSSTALPGVLSRLMSREDFFSLCGRIRLPQD